MEFTIQSWSHMYKVKTRLQLMILLKMRFNILCNILCNIYDLRSKETTGQYISHSFHQDNIRHCCHSINNHCNHSGLLAGAEMLHNSCTVAIKLQVYIQTDNPHHCQQYSLKKMRSLNQLITKSTIVLLSSLKEANNLAALLL